MKNYKLPLAAFALLLFIASCKKEDVQQNDTKTSVTNAKRIWNPLNNWSTVQADDNTTTYFSKIADTSINDAVVNSGLVLVFKKNGSAIQSLPFEENLTGTFWYYQISKGALRISVSDNTSSQRDFSEQSFSYLIFTPEKILALNEQGKTKVDLMQLSFEQALELSK